MHGKRTWLRPTSMALALPVVGLLVWGMLGGGRIPGSSGAAAPRESTGGVPALVAASSATQPAPADAGATKGWGV